MDRRDTLASAEPAAPPALPEIRAQDGTRLFHRDWGEGRPVVFAASWALPSEMWAYQVAHLSEAGFRCIAYDRRGHGRSDAPASGYDIDTFADDLAAVIEGLDLQDVALVGHSLGCVEIARYLGRHGTGRVSKAAFVAPAGPCLLQSKSNPDGAPQAYFDEMWGQWRTDFPGWLEANKAPFFTPQTSRAMVEWGVDMLRATPVPVVLATGRALAAADVRPDLARIDRPALVIHGDQDASAPIELTGRRFAAGIKGAEFKLYPGAPHGIFLTHMEQVNRELEAFLSA